MNNLLVAMTSWIPSLSDSTKNGDVLITSNTLISSYHLLQKKIPLTAGVLLDFCTLLKALTFHDRILVLPAEIRDELGDSRLFKYLKKRKMLYSLSEDFAFALDNPFLGDLVGKEPSKFDIEHEWVVPFKYTYYQTNSERLAKRQNDMVNEIIAKKFKIETLFDERHGELAYRYRLRTALYYELSNKLNLPFFPDFTRIPILLDYDTKIRESLSMMINRKVDEKYIMTLKELMSIAGMTKIPLPNAVIRFLKLYPKHGLEESLDTIREEFRNSRKKIIDWENALKSPRLNNSDALKILKKINESIDSIAPYDASNVVVSMAPSVASDFLNQGISWGSFAGLAEKSIHLFKKWLLRRNVTFFANAINEAKQLSNEQQLLKSTFASGMSSQNIDKFLTLNQTFDNLYDRSIKTVLS